MYILKRLLDVLRRVTLIVFNDLAFRLLLNFGGSHPVKFISFDLQINELLYNSSDLSGCRLILNLSLSLSLIHFIFIFLSNKQLIHLIQLIGVISQILLEDVYGLDCVDPVFSGGLPVQLYVLSWDWKGLSLWIQNCDVLDLLFNHWRGASLLLNLFINACKQMHLLGHDSLYVLLRKL